MIFTPNTINAYDARSGVAYQKSSPLFFEPTAKQAAKARAAVAELKAAGWSYQFRPYNTLGERIVIVDPGNRGRLDAATRQRFNAAKNVIEILTERRLAVSRLSQVVTRDGLVAGVNQEAKSFSERAFQEFKGSRVYF